MITIGLHKLTCVLGDGDVQQYCRFDDRVPCIGAFVLDDKIYAIYANDYDEYRSVGTGFIWDNQYNTIPKFKYFEPVYVESSKEIPFDGTEFKYLCKLRNPKTKENVLEFGTGNYDYTLPSYYAQYPIAEFHFYPESLGTV